MRYIILGVIFSFSASQSNSQVYLKRFYNIDGEETDSISSYSYKTWIANPVSEVLVISYYTKSNSLKLNEGIKDENGETLRTYYYPTGAIKSEGRFDNAGPKGLLRSYYINGDVQSELFFEKNNPEDDKKPSVGIINYWDSLGNQIISDGKGICYCNLTPFFDKQLFEKGLVVDGLKSGEWQGDSKEDQYSFAESYDRGVLIHGVQKYKGASFEYDRLEIPAAPKGGLGSFYEHVGAVMRYPTLARRRSTQGKVFLEFLVEEDGRLTHIDVVKGIGDGCDEEAVEAIASAPKWNYARRRGRPVKQRMMLPIIFKLG